MDIGKTFAAVATTWICVQLATPILPSGKAQPVGKPENAILLPEPNRASACSVEEALQRRRSVREYTRAPLTLPEISQLLWAAQGITQTEDGLRTAPSAGALYPLELYLVVGDVENLSSGIYKYRPSKHVLEKVSDGDIRQDLFQAALEQECVRDAPILIVLTAVYERTTKKYDQRGIRYANIEVGCAAENILLQATALNLGAVLVGAFHDDKVKDCLKLAEDESPLAVIPVGRVK